jgi:hypothetical protein
MRCSTWLGRLSRSGDRKKPLRPAGGRQMLLSPLDQGYWDGRRRTGPLAGDPTRVAFRNAVASIVGDGRTEPLAGPFT